MSIKFLMELNEMIIDATLEATDEETLAEINESVSDEDVKKVRTFINQSIQEKRQERLAKKKANFGKMEELGAYKL